MKKRILNKIGKLLLIINTSLFIISFSISFVILFRPFYYYHINYLDLENKTGYSYNEIKKSYDDVMDYLILNKDFKTGRLIYSEEGKDHFKDCKELFIFNFVILGITGTILLTSKIYLNKLKIKRHSISFWGSILVLSTFILILIVAFIVGFETCFDTFHNIFFLGKDNWLLNPNTDEIIRILPQAFFMNCAIFVISLITFISLVIIGRDIYLRKKLCNNK